LAVSFLAVIAGRTESLVVNRLENAIRYDQTARVICRVHDCIYISTQKKCVESLKNTLVSKLDSTFPGPTKITFSMDHIETQTIPTLEDMKKLTGIRDAKLAKRMFCIRQIQTYVGEVVNVQETLQEGESQSKQDFKYLNIEQAERTIEFKNYDHLNLSIREEGEWKRISFGYQHHRWQEHARQENDKKSSYIQWDAKTVVYKEINQAYCDGDVTKGEFVLSEVFDFDAVQRQVVVVESICGTGNELSVNSILLPHVYIYV